jgi:hypothetical protein
MRQEHRLTELEKRNAPDEHITGMADFDRAITSFFFRTRMLACADCTPDQKSDRSYPRWLGNFQD